MAPVAVGIADGKKDWQVGAAGGGKCLFAPWAPIDRIVRMLKKIRGFFMNQPVFMHHSKPPIFMNQLYHVPSV